MSTPIQNPSELQSALSLRAPALLIGLAGILGLAISTFEMWDHGAQQQRAASRSLQAIADSTRHVEPEALNTHLAAALRGMVASHDSTAYGVATLDGRIVAHTFAGPIPAQILDLPPPELDAFTESDVDIPGATGLTDFALRDKDSGVILRIGLDRSVVTARALVHSSVVSAATVLFLILALFLVRRVASATTDKIIAAQLAQHETEERYRRLFELSPDCNFVFDLSAEGVPVIAELNAAACTMHGYTREEMLGMPITELDIPEDAALAFKRADRLMGGEVLTFEVQHLRKDGSRFPVEVIAQKIELGGRITIQAIDRDISERKQAGEGHADLERQVQQAQRLEAMATFAGGVAHNFNNLLQGILGCTDRVLRAGGCDEQATNYLTSIRDGVKRGSAMTRQLLSFSRRRAEQPVPVDLREMIGGLMGLLDELVGHIVTLHVSGKEVGDVLIDPALVEQVVMNLVLNARDAMPSGGELYITLSEIEGDLGRQAVLSVRDTGTGMDAKTAARVFDPFFTTKAVDEGTGLGLSTAHGIINAAGGQITVESELGVGTTFRITLPISAEEAIAREKPPPAPSLDRHLTVLLVDDSPLALEAVHLYLDALGHQVLVAGSPEEALSLSDAHPGEIDLLLTDVLMPDKSGADLAAILLERRPTVRVLFMSAHPGAVLVQQGKLPNGARSIQKPFDLAVLETALARTILSPSA